MEKGLMTIGEIAEFYGVSRKAMRLYEKKGIIKPVKVDPANGYRYYSAAQVEQLNALLVKMVCIEEAGGCLDRIAGMVGGTDYSCFFSSSVCAVHEGSALGNVYLTGGEGEAVREAVGLAKEKAVGLAEEETAGLTGEETAGLTGEETAGLTGEEAVGLTGEEAVGLTAKEAVGLTGGKTAHLTAEQAAHLAGLDEVVSGLGQGIHTPLGKI